MLEVYWGVLIAGALFVLVAIVFGDILDSLFDGILEGLSIEGAPFIHPLTVIGGLTMVGGAGVLLTRYTSLAAWSVFVIALSIALLLSTALYFFYLKPMQQAENSTAFSIYELVGSIAEVSTTIPADGYGEVIVAIGASRTNQIAASWKNLSIRQGYKVVVIDVRNNVLYVEPFEKEKE